MKYINHIILSLLVISLFNACNNNNEVKKEVIRPVKYEIVSKINAQKTRIFSGVASASDEIELSFRIKHPHSKIIAITGSNGKSTTVSLIHHILQTAGYNSVLAGNIGTALSSYPIESEDIDFVVSFHPSVSGFERSSPVAFLNRL